MKTTEERPAVELKLDHPDHVEPRLKIRWCISPEAYTFLRENDIREPYMLIVVLDSKGERRYVQPLESLCLWHTFRRSGDTRVFGTIVWAQKNDNGKMVHPIDLYLSKKNDSYITSVLYSGWDVARSTLALNSEQCHGNHVWNVVVPKEHFANPPWDKKLIQWACTSKFVDQCRIRKFRFWAYPAIMVWLPIHYLMNVFAAFLGLFHGNLPAITAMFRLPWNVRTRDIFSGYNRKGWFPTSPTLRWFKPSNLFICFGAVSFVTRLTVKLFTGDEIAPSKEALIWFGVATFAFATICAFFPLLFDKLMRSKVSEYQNSRKIEKWEKRERVKQLKLAREAEEAERAKKERFETLEVALCSFVDPAHPTNVPKPAQTLSLQVSDLYYEAKNQLCKHYEE